MTIGETTKLTATASYFGGGDLPQTKVDWNVNAVPWNYSPPNWSEYNFGGSDELLRGYYNNRSEQANKHLDSLSDSHGASAVDLSVKSMIRPTTVKTQLQSYIYRRQQTTVDRPRGYYRPSVKGLRRS